MGDVSHFVCDFRTDFGASPALYRRTHFGQPIVTSANAWVIVPVSPRGTLKLVIRAVAATPWCLIDRAVIVSEGATYRHRR
jgi:hypothetical protein